MDRKKQNDSIVHIVFWFQSVVENIQSVELYEDFITGKGMRQGYADRKVVTSRHEWASSAQILTWDLLFSGTSPSLAYMPYTSNLNYSKRIFRQINSSFKIPLCILVSIDFSSHCFLSMYPNFPWNPPIFVTSVTSNGRRATRKRN